jgi:chorismate mutase/prephenate dehydratase
MNDDSMGKLEVIRIRIDEIDSELAKLLNERAACAERVAEIKTTETDSKTPVFYRPERETQILRRIREENTGPLADEDIARLFREIISCCLSLEQSLTIAYLGPEGTFTEAAAVKQFGNFASHSAQVSIDDVFREVESGAAHYGVVPVENSTEGMVNLTLDCLMSSKLNISGEIEVPIHHAFMSAGNADIIATIYSHEQSLAQCRRWLDRHYPAVPRKAVVSNAEAARVALRTEGGAAIAGEMAAARYGLRVLAANIEDEPDNKTRFLVIGKESVGPSGSDKTSILVSTRNEPGALYGVLEPFHRHGVDLTRIDARPSRSGNWNYVFFVDFNGHQSSEEIKIVLQEVGEVATEVRLLGSYPQAVI